MSHSYVSQLMHCVFSTKERRPFITPELQDRLFPYMGGIARKNRMVLIAAGGVADHVHLLLSLPKTLDIAHAIQLIKGGSSKWIHDEFPELSSFQWQGGLRSVLDRHRRSETDRRLHKPPSRPPQEKRFQDRINIVSRQARYSI